MNAAPERCLLVPMHVEAMVIGAAPGTDWVNLKPDFRGINFNQVLGQQLENEPCSTKDTGLDREPGVHLHWALPEGLTHGVAGADGQPQFPPIPNRWLVVRLWRTPDAQVPPVLQHRAWIVESDTITASDEGTTWPALPASGPNPGDERDYAVRLGRRFELDRWPGETSAARLEVTAAGYGDPAFAAYYPACRNMLGFHDRELADLENVSLMYLVAGWYARPDADPLHRAVAESGFTGLTAFVDGAGWTYPGHTEAAARVRHSCDVGAQLGEAKAMAQRMRAARPDAADVHAGLDREIAALGEAREALAAEAAALERSLPARIVCHGVVAGIQWRGVAVRYDSGIPRGKPLRVAVGSSFVEALAALLRTRLDSRAATLLEAFQYDLLTELERPAGEERLEHRLHERGFRPLARGVRWDVGEAVEVATDPTRGEQAWTVPGDVRVLLENLNLRQREVNRLKRERDSKRSELYATWYRSVLGAGDADLTPQLRALEKEIEELTSRLAGLEDARGERPARAEWDRLQSALDALLPGCALRPLEEPRFWRPSDPVVLLAGPAFTPVSRHGGDERLRSGRRLACRLTDQACTGVGITIPDARVADVEFGPADLDRWCDPLGGAASGALPAGLDGALLSLMRETLLLTADSAAARDIAATAYERNEAGLAAAHAQAVERLAADLLNVLARWRDGDADSAGADPAAGSALRVHGVAPSPPAVRMWQQNPWLPLYMQWQVRWRPAYADTARALSGWSLDDAGTRFSFSGPADAPGETQIYAGTTLLTAAAALHFSDRLHQYNLTHDDNRLRAVETAMRAMSVLGQSLGGLTDNLLMRQARLELEPLDPGAAGRGPQSSPIAEWVRDIEWLAPLTDAAFLPIRAGELELTKLWVIDAYGQLLQLEDQDAAALARPVVHERLAGAGGTIRLEPRLAQPARLGIEWLPASRWNADGRDGLLGEDEAFDPVCGWIVPNLLDRGLMIYDARGRALGALQAVQRKSWDQGAGAKREAIESFHWVDVPGSSGFFYGKPPQQIRDPLGSDANPHLRAYVSALLTLTEGSGTAFGQLLDRMDEALSTGRRSDAVRDPGRALLMGRPLALVRALIRLELDGEPARAQGRADAHRDARARSGGIDAVRFPVRLGGRTLWNGIWVGEDGLVGFFLARDYTRFYPAYGLQGRDDAYSVYGRVPEISIGEPLETTLLMEPAPGVCATTGILPRVVFKLPHGDAADVLDHRRVLFYTGPVISTADAIRMPQPSDLYGQWSWTHHPAVEVWREAPITDTRKEEGRFFEGPLMIAEGWLSLETAPLALREFGVRGREPVTRAQQPASPGAAPIPARFEAAPGERIVLTWDVVGADQIELRAGAATLYRTMRHPLPAQFRITVEGDAVFTLIATARMEQGRAAAQEQRTIDIRAIARPL